MTLQTDSAGVYIQSTDLPQSCCKRLSLWWVPKIAPNVLWYNAAPLHLVFRILSNVWRSIAY